jgi:hypothetical protein
MADPTPTEQQECIALAKWLDRHGVLYSHIPMGGLRDKREAAIMKRMGVRAGIPDYLILEPPICAVEMKRRRGGRLSAAQREVCSAMARHGWQVIVAHGAAEAVAALVEIGHGRLEPSP